MILVSDAWKTSYPEAMAGILIMRNVSNPPVSPALETRKRELAARIRTRFAGTDPQQMRSLPELQPYVSYYRRFGKSYHVLLQLESVALRGRSIPSVAALVEAMFLAELDNLMLTAGHDLGAVRQPARLDVASGDERYVKLNGEEQRLKAGDLMMADGEGVISSVLHGPDYRTRITPDTREALFVTYAPPGIEEERVIAHLQAIQANVLLVAPDAETDQLRVCRAP